MFVEPVEWYDSKRNFRSLIELYYDSKERDYEEKFFSVYGNVYLSVGY